MKLLPWYLGKSDSIGSSTNSSVLSWLMNSMSLPFKCITRSLSMSTEKK